MEKRPRFRVDESYRMKILIIDDSPVKAQSISSLLCESEFISESNIRIKSNTSDARDTMSNEYFDIVFLDINLPVYPDSEPSPKEGIEFLKYLSINRNIQIPSHIVGITEYSDNFDEALEVFNAKMWSLINYDIRSNDWKVKIDDKIKHIYRSKINGNRFENVDICILTTVDVETRAVRSLPYNWERISLKNDPTIYYKGELTTKYSQTLSIVTTSSSHMGMVPASVITTKLIMNFQPKYIFMVGICAGVKDKTAVGDIIVGDPIWSYESGKRTQGPDGNVVFLPSPHQISLDDELRNKFQDLKFDMQIFQHIFENYNEKKPSVAPRLHVAPIGSGSAVISDESVIRGIADNQNRDILGLEMEGYGLYFASKMTNSVGPKFVLIKSVCDFADETKNDNYQSYSSHVSCGFLDYFLKNNIIGAPIEY
ncbi:response regulator [Vibrio parahaemolyticus]|nr:response regulator [Vibrio parahaemolyticus]HAS6603456.1 response regulator [Vibrio parahaemolyticus]